MRNDKLFDEKRKRRKEEKNEKKGFQCMIDFEKYDSIKLF